MLKDPLLTYSTVEETLNSIVNIMATSIEVNLSKVEVKGKKDRAEFKKLKDIELEYIRKVMNYTGDNIAKASEILGIGRTTIYRKLKSE